MNPILVNREEKPPRFDQMLPPRTQSMGTSFYGGKKESFNFLKPDTVVLLIKPFLLMN
jgi:hypothetical protein